MPYTYSVYEGRFKNNGKLAYIGTTIQKPADRFRWHKANKKDFDFKVLFQYDNPDEMIDMEFKLIKELNPPKNKIKHRKQNLNRQLSQRELNKRVGDNEWCQSCLRRRVNQGYKKCKWC